MSGRKRKGSYKSYLNLDQDCGIPDRTKNRYENEKVDAAHRGPCRPELNPGNVELLAENRDQEQVELAPLQEELRQPESENEEPYQDEVEFVSEQEELSQPESENEEPYQNEVEFVSEQEESRQPESENEEEPQHEEVELLSETPESSEESQPIPHLSEVGQEAFPTSTNCYKNLSADQLRAKGCQPPTHLSEGDLIEYTEPHPCNPGSAPEQEQLLDTHGIEEDELVTVDAFFVEGDGDGNDNDAVNINAGCEGNRAFVDDQHEVDVGAAPLRVQQTHDELRRVILQEQFTSAVTTRVNASPAEALLMTLVMAQENNLTFKAFVDSTKLVNSLFISPIILKSAYLLDKVLHSSSGIIGFFYCSKCFYFFGQLDYKTTIVLVCPQCNLSNKIKDLTRATYFAVFPLPQQIELLLMDKKVRDNLVNPKEIIQNRGVEVMTDVYDGICYKKFASSLPDNCNEKIISFVMCTDGSPLFKSSNCSIWPFFLSINELPPVERMGNLLIGGLWFGVKKPPMDIFLQPLADHIKSLSVNGFRIVLDNEEILFKAYGLACCVDSGARGAVQGLNSHSGYYSCSWCEISGEYNYNKVIFPFQETPPKVRTHEDVVKYAKECVADQRLQYVYGVQLLTPLADLPKFDVVNGMVQDFPHNVPFGIARTFLQEWLSNTSRAFYIGSPEDSIELDKKMLLLTPPIEVRRPVRKVSDNAHWNAREYENWTLFYSIVVLTNILPLKFLNHWGYLVQAIYLLSRQTLSHNDVNNAHKLLICFVSGVEEFYGDSHMSYNVHILGHLAENAARWGPIWAVSTYCFESGIKDLKGLIHAQRGVAHQIHRALCYRQAAQILRSTCSTNKTYAFEETIKPKPNKMTKYLPLEQCVLLGSSKDFVATEEENYLLMKSAYNVDISNCAEYKKIIAGKCVYTSDDLSSGKRFNNSVALTTTGHIIVIKKLLLDKSSEKVFLFCVDVFCNTFLRLPQGVRISAQDHCLRVVSSIGRRQKLLSVEELQVVCVKSELNDKIYVTPFPTLYNVF